MPARKFLHLNYRTGILSDAERACLCVAGTTFFKRALAIGISPEVQRRLPLFGLVKTLPASLFARKIVIFVYSNGKKFTSCLCEIYHNCTGSGLHPSMMRLT